MADVAAPPAASTEAPATPKKAAKKEKKTAVRPKASHPTTAVMVNAAIQSLKERGGSSLQAIKKYISATYKIDAEKFSPFIKKYIKTSVASGSLVQTKGKGASGSFKLASAAVTVSGKSAAIKIKKPAAKSPAKPKAKPAAAEKKVATPKRAAAKKVAKPKRVPAVAEKKKPVAKVVKPKTPSKAKRTTKTPTKKPKSPKPKTTRPKAAAKTAKKTSPKKK